ncbi:hypothetical protein C7E12_07380, partial [Stenotrophomonas maltophilia]
LDEHFHKEDEVRFFVAGSGLFTLHVGDKVYEIERAVKDDLIAVPARSSSTSTSTRKTRCASSSPAPACSPCTWVTRSMRSSA